MIRGMYRGNQPLATAAMQPVTGTATAGQNYIPIPGGVNAGLNLVVVGGGVLLPGDFDDSDGAGVLLASPMAAGTAWMVVSFTYNTSYVPVQGQLAGFRNLLINADGRVNQRAYASGAATTGANQYTLDRWRIVTAGQNLSLSLTSNGYTMTAPAGGMEQVVEGNNVIGGTYSLNWTGTATATVNGMAVAKRGNIVLTPNTNTTVRFTGGTVYLPQLEYGSVATQFDQRPTGVELELAMRYYQFFSQVMSGGACGVSGNGYFTDFMLPVPMRASPTAVYSNISYLNGTGLSTNTANPSHLRTSFSCTAGSTAYAIADIALTAEL